MKQWYQITLYSQMGPRGGKLFLQQSGDGTVQGTLSLAGYENQVQGTWDGAENLTLLHSLRTAIGDHLCRSELHLVGDTLQGTAELDGCRMKWSGARMREEETEEKHCE